MPRSRQEASSGNHMGFSNNSSRRWRTALTLLAVAALAGVIGLCANYEQMRASYDLCEVAEPHTLSGPAGQKIEMDTRFCGLLAGDPGTIVVRFRSAGS